MGVSGAGKTTIGHCLADMLAARFADGDDFHPDASIAKMSGGIPLTDDDRQPWLARLAAHMTGVGATGGSCVIACSALRRCYRDILRTAPGRVVFVHLTLPREVVAERLVGRLGHFMPLSLLPSQLAALEGLTDDEAGITMANSGSPDTVAAGIIDALGLRDRRRAAAGKPREMGVE
nr:gluconokinase [Corynebacterium mendelii]